MQDKNKKIGILNKGENNKFINNEFHGFDVGIQDEGQQTLASGNKFRSVEKYVEDVKDLPIWLKYALAIFAIVGTIGTLYGAWGTYLNQQKQLETITSNIATSTVNLAEILSKAASLETVIERQDFLNKYKDSFVSGQGIVEQVSRSGIGFLVDIKINGQTITCSQGPSEELEKQLLLLKGKQVQFYGKFPFTSIFEHGLAIDDCILSRLL